MKHTVEKISPSRVKLVADVDKELWTNAQEKAFKKTASKVSVPGFRPGKAPRKLVEERINQQAVWNEAIDEVITPVFASLLTEEKLQPMYRPNVNVTKLSKDELELVYTIVLIPEVTLGEYKGIKATKVAPKVTEKEVEDDIANLLKNNAELVVTDREAKIGDTTVIDFDGYLADEEGKLKAFEGGQANNYSLELGSNQFIPGFEEQLVGMKDGDKKDIKVTFPTNYVKELAGKEATFKITMHEVKEKKVPELTDDAVKDLAIAGVNTVAELKEHETKHLLSHKVQDAENAFYNEVMGQIVKNSTFVIDDAIIENEAHQMEENLKKQIESNGLTFEQYLEITGSKQEDLHATYHVNAENNIKNFLVSHEIGIKENLAATDADIDAEIKKMAEQYKMKEEDVKNIISKNLEDFRSQLSERKVHEFVLANNGSAKEEAKAEAKEEKEAAPKKVAAKKTTAKKTTAKKSSEAEEESK